MATSSGCGDAVTRDALPAEMRPRSDFSIWEFLRNCVGKELTRIAMPVHFNEPLSFLQRVCEYLEYSELLFAAAKEADPLARIELVSAFAVSGASSNWCRLGKPFNPLLGETYELRRGGEGGFSVVCEQVSHHPPTSAFHAEAADGSWRFHGAISPKLTFWGKSVEVNPKGQVTLELRDCGETFTWHNVQCKIHNVVIGRLWLEHHGELNICSGGGYNCQLKWHSATWLHPDCHRVDGFVMDASGAKVRAVFGKWVDSLYSAPTESWKQHKREINGNRKRSPASTANGGAPSNQTAAPSNQAVAPSNQAEAPSNQTAAPSNKEGAGRVADEFACEPFDARLPGQRRLWRRAAPQASSSRFFSFTRFALALNDDSDVEFLASLPPTDSRRRPDIRAFEAGDLELAQAEKARLEERQRAAARRDKAAAAAGQGGRWFDSDGGGDWRFNGEYWQREWGGCPDIY